MSDNTDLARRADAGGDLAPRTPQQRVLDTIRNADFQAELALALPENVSPARFARVATTALLENPEIAECTPDSIVYALLRAAADGRVPDGKQGALVAVNAKVKGADGRDQWVKKADWRPMIYGFVQTAAEYGWTLRTQVVYANDEFDYTDEPPTLAHRSVRPGMQRGELIAAYAIATHRDGRRLQRVLHPEDVARRRASAQTSKVWEKHPAAMWAKSAGRDLFEDLPLDPADKERALAIDAAAVEPSDATEMLYGPVREIPAGTPAAALPSAGGAPTIDAAAGTAVQQAEGATGSPTAAPSAPGTDTHGEPPLNDEPGYNPPAGVPENAEVTLAQAASQVVIPIGQWKGVSLAEVLEKGEKGVSWLRYALREFDDNTGTNPSAEPRMGPGELLTAVWDFARVYAPDVYQQVRAEKEATAA